MLALKRFLLFTKTENIAKFLFWQVRGARCVHCEASFSALTGAYLSNVFIVNKWSVSDMIRYKLERGLLEMTVGIWKQTPTQVVRWKKKKRALLTESALEIYSDLLYGNCSLGCLLFPSDSPRQSEYALWGFSANLALLRRACFRSFTQNITLIHFFFHLLSQEGEIYGVFYIRKSTFPWRFIALTIWNISNPDNKYCMIIVLIWLDYAYGFFSGLHSHVRFTVTFIIANLRERNVS